MRTFWPRWLQEPAIRPLKLNPSILKPAGDEPMFLRKRKTSDLPINDVFGEKLLRCFNDPSDYGVHQLFNDWWSQAPEAVIAEYARDFDESEAQKAFYNDEFLAPKVSMETLKSFKPGTLGRGFHDFISNNGLEENIARNYKMLHDMMKLTGKLRTMPENMQYQVIRGFQLHDILHVLTGYEATGEGEIALQAFCLAQFRFPYFAMWMSVITTRVAMIEPELIDTMMTAITDGWSYGKRARNIQFEKWETRLGEPLADLRREFGLDCDRFGLAA
jgi:ubiquinone biosynthesis protein Coq4